MSQQLQNPAALRDKRNLAILHLVLEGQTAATIAGIHGVAAGRIRALSQNAARFLWCRLSLASELRHEDIPRTLSAFRKERAAWLSRLATYRGQSTDDGLMLASEPKTED